MENDRIADLKTRITEFHETTKEIADLSREIDSKIAKLKKSKEKGNRIDDVIQMEDRLQELKPQLYFILRALAAMSADEIDIGLRPTVDEAYQGVMLGQQLCQELIDIAVKLFEKIRQQ